MKKRLFALFVSALMALTLLPVASGAEITPELTLDSRSVGNTGAVLTVKASGMTAARISAASSDESLATVRVENGVVTVQGQSGAVGVARITVTAEDERGRTAVAMRDVPVGYTTFYFSGSSVTVIEGSDNKYEVVGQSPDDELDHELAVSTDGEGRTVYTASGGIRPSVAIKKAGGAYVFMGNCPDGAISVKKEATGNAFILLNGLTLSSSFTSPITIKKDSTAAVVITALAGTVNTLSDAEFNNADVYGPEADGGDGTNQFYAESAVIKAKRGATVYLNGEGALRIIANAKNGIKTGENSLLEISETNLTVTSPKNGVSSENELFIRSGVISVTTQTNDAIKAEDDTAEIGKITVTGGEITINSADEGLAAAQSVNIYGGRFNITCEGDAIKAENSDETSGDVYVTGGEFTINTTCDGFQAAGDLTFRGGNVNILACGGSSNTAYNKDTMPSAKGIKAGSRLTVYGGVFDIDSADDAVHSNGSVTLLGGVYTLATTDDGVHADYVLTLGEAGGDDSAIDLTVNTCYEGLEGATILGYSGRYTINCNEDCINAANSDLSGYSYAMRFYGGEFYCYGSTGDGLDSNGELSNFGAHIEVYSPGRGNSALDSDGTMGLYGGTTVAVGSGEMLELPSVGRYVRFGSSGWGGGSVSLANGDAIAVYDSSNNQLFSGTVRYHNTTMTSNSVIFSCPALVSGQTYYLYKNGSQAASAAPTGSPGNIPVEADPVSWQSVGTPSEYYTRVTAIASGLGVVITGTAGNYALGGGSSVTGVPVTVSAVSGGYALSGVTEACTWRLSASGKLYCTVGGTNYYLAYSQSGGGWNPSYTLNLTTVESAAPTWAASASGSYARLYTVASMGGGPGGPGGPGGARTLYLTANGAGFSLSTSGGNLYIYSPDSAQAALTGVTDYFVNLDAESGVSEAQIFANAQISFKSGLNAAEQTLSWTDSRVSLSWSPEYNQAAAGDYCLTVSVLGTALGTIRVIAVRPSEGSGAPVPPELEIPEPPVGGLMGDTDGDGRVSVADALLALRCSMGLITLDSAALARADIDGNGSITVSDAIIILRMSLGLVG